MKSSLDNFPPKPRPKMWQKFDIEGTCIRNLFRQDRWWMENSFMTFWGDWGKTFSTNVQTTGATTPGSCIVTVLWLMHHSCSSFWLPQRWQSSPHPSYSPDLTPYDFFLLTKMKLKFKEQLLTALKRSRTNHGMWWRCWCEMTSSSASDHGNPTGIAVSKQKGTTLKRVEANRIFGKWLSCSRGISGIWVAPRMFNYDSELACIWLERVKTCSKLS